MKTFKLLTQDRLDGLPHPRAGLDNLCKISVYILSLFCFGLPSVFESGFDSDPVEDVEVEADEAIAIRCRNGSLRRVLLQGSSTNVLRMRWFVADRPSGRLAYLNDVVVPHDFDLRNGLGANLRC